MNWTFKPALWPTVATAILFSLFIRLGYWQLDRAAEKESQHQIYLMEKNRDPERVNNIDQGLIDAVQWKSLLIRGVFHPEIRIILDNQSYRGRSGYFVFYPFQAENADDWLLVNLGWVAGDPMRSKLPELPVISDVQELNGMLKQAPFSGIKLSDTKIETFPDHYYRAQRIEYSPLSAATGLKLKRKVLRLEKESDDIFTRQWPEPASGKEKNIAYAFQWFAFAAVLLVIYLSINLKRNNERRKST